MYKIQFLFPHQAKYLFWVEVLDLVQQVDVGDSCSSHAAAETRSLEEVGMEWASTAVSGARSILFVSSWLGLRRYTHTYIDLEIN